MPEKIPGICLFPFKILRVAVLQSIRPRTLFACLFLVLATLAIYWPARELRKFETRAEKIILLFRRVELA